MSPLREETPNFWNTCRRCVFTVLGEMKSRVPTSRFVRPSATSRATARSVSVRLAQPVAGRRRAPRTPLRRPRSRSAARTRTAQAVAASWSHSSSAPSNCDCASVVRPAEANTRAASSSVAT